MNYVISESSRQQVSFGQPVHCRPAPNLPGCEMLADAGLMVAETMDCACGWTAEHTELSSSPI